MKNRMHFTVVFSFIIVMFIILNSVVPGMAAPVIIHQGSAAPEDEGWIKSTGTGEHKMEGGSETTLSGVHEYWPWRITAKLVEVYLAIFTVYPLKSWPVTGSLKLA